MEGGVRNERKNCIEELNQIKDLFGIIGKVEVGVNYEGEYLKCHAGVRIHKKNN